MSRNHRRVLLIEDDVVDREVVQRMLQSAFTVEEAITGIQGVEAVSSAPPDCVLLGSRLADTHPLDVLAHVVAAGTVPVVVLAETGDEDLVDRALQTGALGFLAKSSLTAQNLRCALEVAMENARLRREVQEAYERIESLEALLAVGAEAPELPAADLATPPAVNEAERPRDPVDLNDVIRQVLTRLNEPIRLRNASIEVEPLPVVGGDRSTLAGLLESLVSNAIEFHGLGSPVVRIGSRVQDGDREIWVQDNGIGIDPEQQARLVNQHGGRIRVDSSPGQGSTFRFTVPPPPWEEASPPA